ncbi:nicotinamide mononucleotide transporter [Pseudomonas putida]|uniref:Nicotinamide mononucleotide transporter n=1 Tax=Pseudomonas putida TaxID=303 RepID=A0A8I1JIS4_PSEPU|nr:nicotinamide mononucleotide transporter [Pseudomonas putida]MBI6882849.1 nicotinamide mononucleotide transporter [Pseudomonas putida]
MILSTIFEWIGTCSGILGAAMVASKTRFSPFGWIAFMLSSLNLGIFAYLTDANGLLLLESVFFLTNVLGLWQWLIKPYIERSNEQSDQGDYEPSIRPEERTDRP